MIKEKAEIQAALERAIGQEASTSSAASYVACGRQPRCTARAESMRVRLHVSCTGACCHLHELVDWLVRSGTRGPMHATVTAHTACECAHPCTCAQPCPPHHHQRPFTKEALERETEHAAAVERMRANMRKEGVVRNMVRARHGMRARVGGMRVCQAASVRVSACGAGRAAGSQTRAP